MVESAKRHEENSNIIKEIRPSTNATIRNQGSLFKTLEIQIGQMSKVLQERGFGSLPSSTKINPRDQVKSISTAKADFSEIRRIRCDQYAVSVPQHKSIFSKIVPFPRRLQNYDCDDWIEAQDVDHRTADRTIKQPRGIAENVLVRIGKFIFPIDFIILDIPEDEDVPLILGRPFLSTALSKIDVYKRKITLRYFSIIIGFTIIDGDDVTKGVVLGMNFCKKYASCQMIMKKFALGDKCERIKEE
ncbi:retrovirus-related pol polyprotein from transposon TNT 1-94 [Tanacetum coccineum]